MTDTTSTEQLHPGEQWIRSLSASPVAALNHLLEGTFTFDRPVERDAAQLLHSWFRPSGHYNEHLAEVDQALADWLTDRWARLSRGDYQSVAWEADTWSTALRAVKLLRVVPRSSGVLASLFAERGLLGAITLGPSRDPLADFLRAVAVTQNDDSYVEEWWALCDLRDLEPVHRGEIGIVGLRHLPRPASTEGFFHSEIVWAFCRYGAALHRLDVDGQFPDPRHRERFVLLGRRLQAEYPFPERWAEHVARVTRFVRVPVDWLRAAIPTLETFSANGQAVIEPSEGRESRDPTWVLRSQQIRQDLALGTNGSVELAEVLLEEQRSHAAVTGDTWPIVASASSFAKGIRQHDPQRAFEWAREATEWDPDDPYPWSEAVSALLLSDGPLAALPLAWLASERFPWHSAALNLLGHVLMRSRQLDLAEAIYQASQRRFPEDPHSLGGLAEVLKHKGTLDEAESLYRTGIQLFPANGVLRCGLAAVLRLAGPTRWDEAEELLREARNLTDGRHHVPQEAARLAAARTALERAEPARSELLDEWDHDTVSEEEAAAWIPDAATAARAAHSIRAASRVSGNARSELAWKYILLAKEHQSGASTGRVAAEEALLTLETGEVDNAAAIAEAAVAKQPGAVPLLYAQAKTRRVSALARSTRFSEEMAAALNDPWTRLASIRSFPKGLPLLGYLRSAAALSNGRAADDALNARWNHLRNWLTYHSAADGRSPAAIFARGLLLRGPISTLAERRSSLVDVRRLINGEAMSLDDIEEAAVLSSS